MLWKVGLKEQRERKNKSKVTQELDENKSKEKEKIHKKYKQEKKRVTYTNEERRENSKMKECEKLGEIK